MAGILSIALGASPPPYAPLVAVHYLRRENVLGPIDIHYKDAALIVEQNKNSNVDLSVKGHERTIGTEQVLKQLVSLFPGNNLLQSSKDQVFEWIEIAASRLNGSSYDQVAQDLAGLDDHLIMRTVFVAHNVSLADIAVWGAIKSNGIAMNAVKKNTFTHVGRWFRFIDNLEFVQEAVETLQKETQLKKKASKKGAVKGSNANYEIGLQDAVDGQVVTRFPPEPSGFLHIGHAKAALLNDYFAKQYHGKLIIRFDDTNPTKENAEFQDAILEDCDLMAIKPHKVSYSSDYFDYMYKLVVDMLKQGKAYADDTDQMTMRQQRFDGKPSARRDQTVAENLKAFEEMSAGSEEGLRWCLRAKISVDDPNKAMRDPVIYRCNLTPHHRTKDAWKVYPTYDFCCPVVDALEGVTHALRTIEYRDREPQYAWMLSALDLRKVHVWEFSRMNFVRTLLSKRKLQKFVDTGFVSGWDDPRMPTVRGVRRRGMTIEALRQYIISQGPSKNILNLEWTSIWAVNKKVIDPVAPRHTAITKDRMVSVELEDGPSQSYDEEKPLHKKNPDVGTKQTTFFKRVLVEQEDAALFSDGEELTLMDWGNAIIQKIEKDADSDAVTHVKMKLHLEGDFKKTEKKVTWIADTEKRVDVRLSSFDYLITKEKLEENDNYEDFLTPQTETRVEAIADANVAHLKKGQVIQFERKGYFICDQPFDGTSAVFFDVPDGKVVNRYGAKTPAPTKTQTKRGGATDPRTGSNAPMEPALPDNTYLIQSVESDLKLVQKWTDVSRHTLSQGYIISGVPPNKPLALVYPSSTTSSITPKALAQVFDQAEARNLVSIDSRGVESRPVKSIYLAARESDSTIVYYRVSDGLIRPRQHGED